MAHSEWASWNIGKIIMEDLVLFDIYYLTSIKHLLTLKSHFISGVKKSVMLIKSYLLGLHSKASVGEWYVIWYCLVSDLVEEKLAKRGGGKCVWAVHACMRLTVHFTLHVFEIFHNDFFQKENLTEKQISLLTFYGDHSHSHLVSFESQVCTVSKLISHQRFI